LAFDLEIEGGSGAAAVYFHVMEKKRAPKTKGRDRLFMLSEEVRDCVTRGAPVFIRCDFSWGQKKVQSKFCCNSRDLPSAEDTYLEGKKKKKREERVGRTC